MKTIQNIPAALGFLILMTSTAFSQGLVFEKTVHNFGEIKQRQPSRAEFHYKNTGSDTVFLLKPRATCGCTGVLLSNPVVPPNGGGAVGVEFSAYAGTLGQVEKNVYVFQRISGEERQIATLTIKAEVIGEIRPDTSMLRFDVVAGDTVRLKLGLTSVTDMELVLDNISVAMMEYRDTTAGPSYSAERVLSAPLADYDLRVSKERLEPRGEAEVSLAFATREKGQINGHLRIVLPNSEIRLPVVGIVRKNMK